MASFKLAVGFGVLAAAALLAPTTANAVVLGAAYFVPEAEAMNAVIGFPHGPANATFSVPSPNNPACSPASTLCFDSRTTSYMLGGWLTGGGATILSGTAADLGRNLDIGTSGTIVEFMGNVTVKNGDMFTVTHDDGLQLEIGGVLVIDEPGATAPVTTTRTYTGPSGTFAFDLVYGECCGAPAVLQISLPLVAAPEPASLALLGSALAGLGVALRRRRKVD